MKIFQEPKKKERRYLDRSEVRLTEYHACCTCESSSCFGEEVLLTTQLGSRNIKVRRTHKTMSHICSGKGFSPVESGFSGVTLRLGVGLGMDALLKQGSSVDWG